MDRPIISHAFGWTAEEAVGHARERIATLIGAVNPKEIVFTSGASESDNLALKGVAEFYKEKGNHIVTTVIEHKAVLDTCKRLEKEGYQVTYLPVGNDGRVDPDEVARAINSEIKAGRGSPHGGVFLDIANRRPADYIRKRLPSMYHQFMELAEVDITKEPMEIGPTCHYVMGGVEVDPDSGATIGTVHGLFAAGEVSGGMHGSNRLGGNSLSDLIVFGKLAGTGAADYIRDLGDRKPKAADDHIVAGVRRATEVLKRDSGTNPYVLHDKLQETMQANVGIVRIKAELEKALEDLEGLKKEAETMKAPGTSQYNPGWHEALSMRSLLVTSPYPRDIPGVPRERNISGVSFAVANATGFVARALQAASRGSRPPARSSAARSS